jgi:hypothetical protein
MFTQRFIEEVDSILAEFPPAAEPDGSEVST